MKTKDMAKAILQKYWNKSLPVRPDAIAREMKVRVIGDPTLGAVSGQFALENEGPTIRFNPDDPSVRQRFTIAHELGHYVLSHGDSFRDTTKEYSSNNYNWQEVSANRFAASILMPESAVNQLLKSDGITDIKRLADMFEVSEAAITYRLKNLGWIT